MKGKIVISSEFSLPFDVYLFAIRNYHLDYFDHVEYRIMWL